MSNDFSSFFGSLPPFNRPDSDDENRVKLIMKSLEMAATLKQQFDTLKFMSLLLLEQKIVVERGLNPAHSRTRQVEDFVVHYSDNMPDHVLMVFDMIIDMEFEGTAPSYAEFLAFVQSREEGRDMPDDFKMASGDDAPCKLMPLYCALLDKREKAQKG